MDLETERVGAIVAFKEQTLEIIDSNLTPKFAIQVPPNGLSQLILRENYEKEEWNIVKGEALAVRVIQLLKREDGTDHLDMAFDRW